MRENPCFELRDHGSLVLTLDGACIQSTAKRAHRELTAALLEGREEMAMEEAAVDLLVEFLGTTDFASLRTEHPELTGQPPCRVLLCRRKDGAIRWELPSSE